MTMRKKNMMIVGKNKEKKKVWGGHDIKRTWRMIFKKGEKIFGGLLLD